MYRLQFNQTQSQNFTSTNLRELGGALLLVVLSVVVTLALVEVFLRLFPGVLPGEVRQRIRVSATNIAEPHPTIGHLHKPTTAGTIIAREFDVKYRTDAFGFRNPWPWPKRIDIVALGDSLTFGYGVADDQAWPAILDRALTKGNVLNLGLIGAGPEQYLRVYEQFAEGTKPRWLLVGLYPANDFWDAGLFDEWLKSDSDCNYWAWRDYGKPSGVQCSESLLWQADLFLRQSSIYHVMLEIRNRARSYVRGDYKLMRLQDGSQMVLNVGDFQQQLQIAVPSGPEFQLAVGSLRRLSTLARSRGARVLVLIQPSKEEVYLPVSGQAIPDPNFHLREELARSDIEYLDLTTIFRRQAARGEKLFFETDPHPNAAGYALVAESVLAYIKDGPSDAPENGWKTSESMTARRAVTMRSAHGPVNAMTRPHLLRYVKDATP